MVAENRRVGPHLAIGLAPAVNIPTATRSCQSRRNGRRFDLEGTRYTWVSPQIDNLLDELAPIDKAVDDF